MNPPRHKYPDRPPDGIIKCLPPTWVKKSGGMDMVRKIRKEINEGKSFWFMSFPVRPKTKVLYLYVAFDGHIQFRVNIMDYRAGDGKTNLYGGSFFAKVWAICTGPMMFPPRPIPMRGFRGFRYTEELW